MFGGGLGQTQGNSMFGGGQQQKPSMFGGGQQQKPSMFGGGQQTSMLGGQKPGQTGQTGSSMFGGQTGQTGSSMFGGGQQQQKPSMFGGGQQQQQKPSMFGGGQQTSLLGGQQKPTTSMFGGGQAQTGSMFGGRSTGTSFGGLGGQATGGFSLANAAQGQQQGGAAFVTGNTRFAELPDAYQKHLLMLETAVRNQGRLRDEVKELINTTVQRHEGREIDSLRQKLGSLSTLTKRDQDSLSNVYENVASEIKECERAARQVQKVSMTGRTMHENVYLPSPYHWKKLSTYEKKMDTLQKQIDDVDEYIASRDQTQSDPRVLQEILTRQHAALYNIAGHVAANHAASNKARSALKDYLRYQKQNRVSGGKSNNDYLEEDIDSLFKERKEPRTFKPFRGAPRQMQPQQQQGFQQQNTMGGVNPSFSLTGASTTSVPSFGGGQSLLGGNKPTLGGGMFGGGNTANASFSLGGNKGGNSSFSLGGNTAAPNAFGGLGGGGGNMFGGGLNTSGGGFSTGRSLGGGFSKGGRKGKKLF